MNELQLCCVLVGLPARGKTYIARKIARYFNWLGTTCQVFNVGTYRREMYGAEQPHSFFDPDNPTAEEQRHQAASACLVDMLSWFGAEHTNQIAVYDATNSTKKRRRMVCDACAQQNISVILIESVCGDEDVIRENVVMVKTKSPDYASKRDLAAVSDFLARIAHYARVYETVDESEWPVVRLIDLGRRYEISGLERGGGLCRKARLSHFLINLQPRQKTIYLCRHGESDFNQAGRIGGDGDLSPHGWDFARSLPARMQEVCVGSSFDVWTSSFKRTKQTAQYLQAEEKEEWKALDEIDAGVCEGLTYEEIASRYPKDFAARDKDKFRYRYRGGESYADLVNRLEPIIMELERRPGRTLIIAHQAVLRVIIGYYTEQTHASIPYIHVPLHAIIELEPEAYGCSLKEHRLPIPAANTHRPKPV